MLRCVGHFEAFALSRVPKFASSCRKDCDRRPIVAVGKGFYRRISAKLFTLLRIFNFGFEKEIELSLPGGDQSLSLTGECEGARFMETLFSFIRWHASQYCTKPCDILEFLELYWKLSGNLCGNH
ncbi:hypothetical protein M758_9G184500 [Ceratodon purpureus]|nr:hypothetical protein M758_9G184500 [Ceratodon purpureus]